MSGQREWLTVSVEMKFVFGGRDNSIEEKTAQREFNRISIWVFVCVLKNIFKLEWPEASVTTFRANTHSKLFDQLIYRFKFLAPQGIAQCKRLNAWKYCHFVLLLLLLFLNNCSFFIFLVLLIGMRNEQKSKFK